MTERRGAPPQPKPEPLKLPITRRCLLGPDETQVSLDVFCPSQESTVAADRCAECGFLKTFPRHPSRPGECVECTPPDMGVKSAARRSRHIDMAEAAARVPLGEVVSRQVVCVRPETGMETLIRIMINDGVECLPVVDATWKLVGIVSKSDVLRAHYVDDDEEQRPQRLDRKKREEVAEGYHVERLASEIVRDVMTPIVHTLPEDARLAHAMSLMAMEGVSHVPVVTKDGAIIGVITSLDCLRWAAGQMGYTVPALS
jgi:CBS domain-containing protein